MKEYMNEMVRHDVLLDDPKEDGGNDIVTFDGETSVSNEEYTPLRSVLTEEQQRFVYIANKLQKTSSDVPGTKKGFDRFASGIAKMRRIVMAADRVEEAFKELTNEFRCIDYVINVDYDALSTNRFVRRVYFHSTPIMLLLGLLDLDETLLADNKSTYERGVEWCSEYLLNLMSHSIDFDKYEIIIPENMHKYYQDDSWGENYSQACYLMDSAVVKLIRQSSYPEWLRKRLERWFLCYSGGLLTELFHDEEALKTP